MTYEAKSEACPSPLLLALEFQHRLWDYVPYETRSLKWRLTNVSPHVVRVCSVVLIFSHIMGLFEDYTVAQDVDLGPAEVIEGGGAWFTDKVYVRAALTYLTTDGAEQVEAYGFDFDEVEWTVRDHRDERYRAVYETVEGLRGDHVLVLGKDTGASLDRLVSLKELLAGFDLVGVLLKNLRDIPQQSVEEKLTLCASLAAFAVVDDSEPSGHIDEMRLLANNRIITAIVHAEGTGGSWMQADYEADYFFMKRFSYSGKPDHEFLAEVVNWARVRMEERARYLNKLYPWRYVDDGHS